MAWGRDEISVEIVEDCNLSEGDVITARFATPAGVVMVMGEIALDETNSILIVGKAHIQAGADIRPNDLGL